MHTATPRFRMAARPGPRGRLGGLVSVGRIDGGRGVPGRRARSIDTYAVMLVRDGSGVYRDRAGETPLGPGSLVRLVPGHPHWYGVLGGGRWDEVYLTFAGTVFDAARAGGVLDPGVTAVSPVERWDQRMDSHRTRRPPATVASADREALDLVRLLVDVAEHAGEEDAVSPSGTGWLAASQALLGRDLGEELELPSVATAVGLGYETWRKRFRDETGVSPARYRLRRRVDAAEEALRRSTLRHSEIAASLGFSDAHHLAKQVRALRGLTPTQIRKRG
jgi:AraC-like DNA-binding protein